MSGSRSEYVAKNTVVSLSMQVVKNILAFIGRTIFIKVLGSEYLGVNSLFSELLTILSFAELGIGNAMVFSLYKPIAENNYEKIKSLMKLYEKFYRAIGFVIAFLGILVIPFLDFIVGDVSYVKENITLLYVLFLFNTVISYFFVYKKSLIIANQKNYIVEIYQQVFHALQIILQSIFLIITKEFIVYLVITVLCTIANNLVVAYKANKMYPFLTEKDVKPLEKKEMKSISDNIKALAIYKIGGILTDGTDSIFISAMINVITVGLYANYKMIINIFKTVGSQIMNSIIASVGNLNATATEERKETVFYEMLYINVWFFGFTAVGLCVLLSEFISLWIGSEYRIGFSAVLAAITYYYISNVHYPCFTYRTTAGLFVYGKYVPVISAVINTVLNFILGMKFGLAGILWASVIARVITYELIDPIMIYKYVFHNNVVSYFFRYVAYGIFIVLDGLISYSVCSLVSLGGIVGFVVKALVVSVVFNIVFFAVTVWTKEFKTIKTRIIRLLYNKR